MSLEYCETCYLTYTDCPEDIALHQEVHQNTLHAFQIFGHLQNLGDREESKSEALKEIQIACDHQDKPGMIKGFEKEIRAWFDRSVLALIWDDSYKKHVPFNDFAAMILNQHWFKDLCESWPINIYNDLVNKYGVKNGIDEGCSYFNPK